MKTYPVAEVRAGREDRGHAHVDEEGLPGSQRLVLPLLGRRGLPLGGTCPHGPPSDFSVWTRAEGGGEQRQLLILGKTDGEDAIITVGIPGKNEPRVNRP